jgi:hypothetical protein
MRRRAGSGRVDTRSELLSLLTEACELEHGLACTYLFAAFSLKDEPAEGLGWDDQQRARKWAAQLYFVASQEMLHLAQAWNLLAAVGGTPYYGRPNFPQRAGYYPLALPLELRPFSSKTLDRFIAFEAPEQRANEMRDEARRQERVDGETFDYSTVGELYSLIESGFANIPEDTLFVGPRQAQVGPAFVHFPDIVRVVDRVSARRAIHAIKLQGEGAPLARDDCHFGIFRTLQHELRASKEPLGGFARPCAGNPVTRVRPDQTTGPARPGVHTVTVITHPISAALADFFDDLYVLMLRMLAHAFEPGAAADRALPDICQMAIELMVTCLKPVGEALAMLPLAERGDARAGAPFAMTRVVTLPASPVASRALVVERLGELAGDADRLAGCIATTFPAVSPKVARAAETLQRLRRETELLPTP